MMNISGVSEHGPYGPWSEAPPPRATEPNTRLAVALGLVLVVALLGNVATICNFRYNDWLKTHRCHMYILGLAVADLGTALVPLPVNTLIAAQGLWPLSRQACMAYDYFRVVIENNGVLVTLLISADRLQLLWSDFSSYVKRSTSFRVSVELGLAWLLPALGHGIMAIVWVVSVPLEKREAETSPDCQDVPSEADVPFSILYAVLLIFVPGLLLGVFNTVTFIGVARKLKRRRRIADGTAFRGPPPSDFGKFQASLAPPQQAGVVSALATTSRGPNIPSLSLKVASNTTARLINVRSGNHIKAQGAGTNLENEASASTFHHTNIPSQFSRASGASASHSRRHTDRHMNRYIRPAVMLAGIVTVFALCWFPFATYYVYVHIVCPACFSKEVQLWLRCLMYANSALNPFIYALTDIKLRRGYARIFRKVRQRLTRNI